MPDVPPSLLLLTLSLESVVSLCTVRITTLDFGCHLDWNCTEAETTYTVQTRTLGTNWTDVSSCVRISRRSCDVSHVFPDLNLHNHVRLITEDHPGNQSAKNTQSLPELCDPLNDEAAVFSAPSITVSVKGTGLLVTVKFPCAPSVTCRDDEDEEDEEDEEVMESDCCRSVASFASPVASNITLYDQHGRYVPGGFVSVSKSRRFNPSVVDRDEVQEEFPLLTAGQEFCAVAGFQYNTPQSHRISSPASVQRCVRIPDHTESLFFIIILTSATCTGVLLVLLMMMILLWRRRKPAEKRLPFALALLQDHELHDKSSKTVVDEESLNQDQISVVVASELSSEDHWSPEIPSQSLDGGYYSSPIMSDPISPEEPEGHNPFWMKQNSASLREACVFC